MTIGQLIVSVAIVSSSVGLSLHRLEPRPVTFQTPAKVAKVVPVVKTTQVAKATKTPKAIARSNRSRRHLASSPRRSQKRIVARSKVSQLSSGRLY